ncbi:MAG: PspC domain-containing protein, partial [Oscillospiraceae bacterium]
MKKRLYRIESGKMLAGVCGGIAEYFDIDPTLVRALWVLFCILGGSGILLYIILAVLIPSEDSLSRPIANPRLPAGDPCGQEARSLLPPEF